jgi:hypothetical protein
MNARVSNLLEVGFDFLRRLASRLEAFFGLISEQLSVGSSRYVDEDDTEQFCVGGIGLPAIEAAKVPPSS